METTIKTYDTIAGHSYIHFAKNNWDSDKREFTKYICFQGIVPNDMAEKLLEVFNNA